MTGTSDERSRWVRVGSVRCFDGVRADKAQALKVLEESAEVFGAWQQMELETHKQRLLGNESSGDGDIIAWEEVLLDECADVIQATCNLLHALGVDDARQIMDECEKRNRDRGRITDGN